jgi:hypothetical protein
MANALAAVRPQIEAARDKQWEMAITEEGLRHDWLLNVRARLTPAPEPVEKLRCICGYDARNNERDHNVECFVHNPKLAAAERKEAK